MKKKNFKVGNELKKTEIWFSVSKFPSTEKHHRQTSGVFLPSTSLWMSGVFLHNAAARAPLSPPQSPATRWTQTPTPKQPESRFSKYWNCEFYTTKNNLECDVLISCKGVRVCGKLESAQMPMPACAWVDFHFLRDGTHSTVSPASY